MEEMLEWGRAGERAVTEASAEQTVGATAASRATERAEARGPEEAEGPEEVRTRFFSPTQL